MSAVLGLAVEPARDEFYGLFVGREFESEGRVCNDELIQFGNLTRDNNPIHGDVQLARKYGFSQIPAQGMFVASIAVGALTEHLPDGIAFRGVEFKMKESVFQFHDLLFLYRIERIRGPLVKIKFSVCEKESREPIFGEGCVTGIFPRS